ncbi:MAG: VOC family protein [Acetobacteraceae bacterium]|nr:VOC family protein [Acetobacteraceae bacterium]
MTIQVTTHLNFRGRAREALDFYAAVFGGERTIVTYGDAGAAQDAAEVDHVVWGQVATGGGFRIMAYDVQRNLPWDPGANAFYVALRGTAAPEIEAYWTKLREGATVLQELGPAPWSPLYGKLTDQFGTTWIVDVAAEGNPT